MMQNEGIRKSLHVFAVRGKINSQRQNEQNTRRTVIKYFSELLSTRKKSHRKIRNVKLKLAQAYTVW
jgi:hypothetical protein